MSKDHYFTSAQSYLRRARERILEGKMESLFYAAFELRACIEARVVEYAEALPNIKGKITSWQLAKARLALNRAVPDRRFTLLTIQIDGAQHTVTHTPIPNEVWKNVGRLGDYLHYRHEFDGTDDEQLREFAELVLSVYKDAWIACKGDLIGPLLGRGKPGSKLTALIRFDSPDAHQFNKFVQAAVTDGRQVTLDIKYPEQLPSDWDYDLDAGFDIAAMMAIRDARSGKPH